MNKVEKQDLYNEAFSFYEFAECGRKHIPEKAFVERHIPYIVNMAFCTELYLKFLLVENGKPLSEIKKYSHNLYMMYNDLSQEQKDTIYSSFKRPLIYSIDTELQKINSAFPEWRYLVLNKANGDKKRFQFAPYFIKELNEILGSICEAML